MNSKTISKGRDVVPFSVDLKEIVVQINDAHAEAARSLRASVEHAIRAGELLIEAKRQHGRHGTWNQWLHDNIEFSERLAQAYMRLARLPVEKRNAVADLPLREALSAIRSREEQVSKGKERENRPDPGPACFVFKGKDGGDVVIPAPNLVIAPEHRHLLELVADDPPCSPAPPPATPEEIADDLINQLARALYEARDQISIGDLCAAFDRWVGRSAPLPAENRSDPARACNGGQEKAAPHGQREGWATWGHTASGDGLDIPDYLRRETVS
jgi:hypothetical protein